MNARRGSRDKLPRFEVSALDGRSEQSTSGPGSFSVGKERRYALRRRLGGPQRQILDDLEKMITIIIIIVIIIIIQFPYFAVV